MKNKRNSGHCKKKFDFSEMDADHVKPWSKGGKRADSKNCQMLCKACNRSDNIFDKI